MKMKYFAPDTELVVIYTEDALLVLSGGEGTASASSMSHDADDEWGSWN